MSESTPLDERLVSARTQRPARKRADMDTATATDTSDVDSKDPADESAKPEDGESKRGTQSPAQYDDDGWGDTPVQMRG